MLFESKRLQKLSGLLRESVEVEEADTCESDISEEDQEDQEELSELEEAIRVQVREEIRNLWSSGQIFNKSISRNGNVTVGFPGIGFRK